MGVRDGSNKGSLIGEKKTGQSGPERRKPFREQRRFGPLPQRPTRFFLFSGSQSGDHHVPHLHFQPTLPLLLHFSRTIPEPLVKPPSILPALQPFGVTAVGDSNPSKLKIGFPRPYPAPRPVSDPSKSPSENPVLVYWQDAVFGCSAQGFTTARSVILFFLSSWTPRRTPTLPPTTFSAPSFYGLGRTKAFRRRGCYTPKWAHCLARGGFSWSRGYSHSHGWVRGSFCAGVRQSFHFKGLEDLSFPVQHSGFRFPFPLPP